MCTDNKKVCIVIPIYKSCLDNNEKISLSQCRKVLGKYNIFFIKPQGLKIDIDLMENEEYIEISPEFLQSRKGYSDYVISSAFYELFVNYEYILIYQLDAFAFSDKLLEFCDMGYDYIGAPWLYGLECHVKGEDLLYVGNGGLSLRKVETFLTWIKEKFNEIKYQSSFLVEDVVIALCGKGYINIAPMEVALEFSFDVSPKECYEKNNNKLPFGCHAWTRFERLFWKEIIDQYGYNVELTERKTEEYPESVRKIREQMFLKYFDKNLFNNALKELIKNYHGVLSVFGSGAHGYNFINMIEGTKVRVDAFYDNNASKINTEIEGIPVVSPNEIYRQNKPAILIAMYKPDAIVKQLEDRGLVQGIDFATSRDLQYKMVELAGGEILLQEYIACLNRGLTV